MNPMEKMSARYPVRRLAAVAGAFCVLTLGACGSTNAPYGSTAPAPPGQSNVTSGYGVVDAIERVRADTDKGGIGGSGIGLGTIAGGVVGGVVGSQVGSGRGSTAAAVIGAAGGAYVGHELENRQKQNQAQTADAFKVTVRMEDGSYQAVTMSNADAFRIGDRVRFVNGVLQRY